MTDRTIIDEIRGTVLNVYDYTDENGVAAKGIIIKPDNPEYESFPENLLAEGHTVFNVGQRVVQVVYSYNKPATEDDLKEYEKMKLECPPEIEDFEYITYDEATYDNEIKK